MKDREIALRQHYDAIAEEYEKVAQQLDSILARLDIPPGGSVLDVGCGTGNLTFRLPRRDSLGRVVGVDLSEGVLNVARRHALRAGLGNFQFLKANASRLPLPDAEFDVVVSNMVLHLVEDFRGALAEMVRVLKGGAVAVLQFQGGGDIAPEMMGLLAEAWSEVLPDLPPPRLFNRIDSADVEEHLRHLGIETFEIARRRITMKIPPSKLDGWLYGFVLVSGFWRCGISQEAAGRIEELLAERVRQRAKQAGYFLNTGNILLVEFSKPGR